MNAPTTVLRSVFVLVTVGLLEACGGTSGTLSDAEAAQANLNLGIAYLRQGRPDLAIENLDRALDQDSRLAPAHSAIALAYDQLGDTSEAERHHRRAVELAPADPIIANSYAVFLCRQNRWRDAEPYFERAANNPSYGTPAAALANAGVCAANAGDLEAAEEHFREALSHDPEFADALAGMMELSYREKSYLQARAFMQRYLDVRPATPGVLLLCFNIESELGDRDAAERCAARLREEYPESAELAQLRELERDGQ
ncbi:MAG TPA: type IV pilus biogenesis/stability protein PilW [Gammaproteobacteria bacterium]